MPPSSSEVMLYTNRSQNCGSDIHFRNHSPTAFLDIVFHQSIIATNQHVDIPVVIELMDVMHGIAYRALISWVVVPSVST